MGKLPKKFRQTMAEGRALLPEGYILGKIKSLDMSDNAGPSGAHFYIAVWEVLEPADQAGQSLRDVYSLSDGAAWRFATLFDVLGFTYDSDTDELVGEEAVLYVVQEEQTFGRRKGEIINSVTQILSAEENKDLIT